MFYRRLSENFSMPQDPVATACAEPIWDRRRERGPARVALVDEPAGAVVLVTGAGGAFKQVLIDSDAGARIAELAASANVSVLVFAFMIAGLVRVIQGSATVAMITAAGFTAPLLAISGISEFDRALAVISIAAGATILSHVNDSGFWLVSKYLDLSVNETLKSWTIVSTIVGGVGFTTALVLSLVF